MWKSSPTTSSMWARVGFSKDRAETNMSLAQFWRILWARKFLIVGCDFLLSGGRHRRHADRGAALEGGSACLSQSPEARSGHGRNDGTAARTYVATQIKLIDDYTVTGLAVDKLGWLSDPQLIEQYQRRPQSDTRDFRRWLAQIISDRTKADLSGRQQYPGHHLYRLRSGQRQGGGECGDASLSGHQRGVPPRRSQSQCRLVCASRRRS